ncbi:hypothetical protein R1flu_014834 [Riccia fluitans]|uniref:F-box domain-containing protein n=1 Tax=Riccia fluitans TaxID=41844 RepID=A0ABD1YHH7_9MARC
MSLDDEVDLMEQEKDVEYWPQQLLQMVFCRIPFLSRMIGPQISPRWRSLFSNALHSANPDLACRIFQEEVISGSSSWPDLCPLFQVVDGTDNKFWAYNQSSGGWQEVPDHQSYKHSTTQFVFRRTSGPLICSVERVMARHGTKRDRNGWTRTEEWPFVVSIVNIFTGSQRVLPPLPDVGRHLKFSDRCHNDREFQRRNRLLQSCPQELILDFDSEHRSYKIYLLYDLIFKGQFGGTVVFEYNSLREVWIIRWNDARIEGQSPDVKRTSTAYLDGIETSTTYLDGVVYYMTVKPIRIWKYDVKAESWAWPTIFADPARELEGKSMTLDAWGMVTVGSDLMVVTVVGAILRAYNVDRETMLLRESFSLMTTIAFTGQHYRLVSYSRSIFFWPNEAEVSSSVLLLDIRTRILRQILLPRGLMRSICLGNHVALIEGIFQPGNHPFTSV